MNDRIQVFGRIRPLTTTEIERGDAIVATPLEPSANIAGDNRGDDSSGEATTIHLGAKSSTILNKSYRLDGVIGPNHDQRQVFGKVIPLLESLVDGFNCSLFTYGQTGTGKTFTMLGYDYWNMTTMNKAQPLTSSVITDDETNMGIIPRATIWIFNKLANLAISPENPDHRLLKASIVVSYIEIYNDKIVDLLNPNPADTYGAQPDCDIAGPFYNSSKANIPSGTTPSATTTPLEIRETKKGEITVTGLTQIQVKSIAEVMEVLWVGAKTRAIAATDMNDYSSRSHTIFQIQLDMTFGNSNGNSSSPSTNKKAKLCLVDLAGSEKWKSHQLATFSQDRIKEFTFINKSLSALGNCISALLKSSRAHIPYRDSKLTRLLQDSLGGNTKTIFIVTISPSSAHLDESVSTLQFADRAMRVRIQATINKEESLLNKARLVERYQEDVIKLKRVIGVLLERCVKDVNIDDVLPDIEAIMTADAVAGLPQSNSSWSSASSSQHVSLPLAPQQHAFGTKVPALTHTKGSPQEVLTENELMRLQLENIKLANQLNVIQKQMRQQEARKGHAHPLSHSQNGSPAHAAVATKASSPSKGSSTALGESGDMRFHIDALEDGNEEPRRLSPTRTMPPKAPSSSSTPVKLASPQAFSSSGTPKKTIGHHGSSYVTNEEYDNLHELIRCLKNRIDVLEVDRSKHKEEMKQMQIRFNAALNKQQDMLRETQRELSAHLNATMADTLSMSDVYARIQRSEGAIQDLTAKLEAAQAAVKLAHLNSRNNTHNSNRYDTVARSSSLKTDLRVDTVPDSQSQDEVNNDDYTREDIMDNNGNGIDDKGQLAKDILVTRALTDIDRHLHSSSPRPATTNNKVTPSGGGQPPAVLVNNTEKAIPPPPPRLRTPSHTKDPASASTSKSTALQAKMTNIPLSRSRSTGGVMSSKSGDNVRSSNENGISVITPGPSSSSHRRSSSALPSARERPPPPPKQALSDVDDNVSYATARESTRIADGDGDRDRGVQPKLKMLQRQQSAGDGNRRAEASFTTPVTRGSRSHRADAEGDSGKSSAEDEHPRYHKQRPQSHRQHPHRYDDDDSTSDVEYSKSREYEDRKSKPKSMKLSMNKDIAEEPKFEKMSSQELLAFAESIMTRKESEIVAARSPHRNVFLQRRQQQLLKQQQEQEQQGEEYVATESVDEGLTKQSDDSCDEDWLNEGEEVDAYAVKKIPMPKQSSSDEVLLTRDNARDSRASTKLTADPITPASSKRNDTGEFQGLSISSLNANLVESTTGNSTVTATAAGSSMLKKAHSTANSTAVTRASSSSSRGQQQSIAATEKLKPLWRTCVDPKSGYTYYHHKLSGISTWEKPPEEQLKLFVKGSEVVDANGQPVAIPPYPNQSNKSQQQRPSR